MNDGAWFSFVLRKIINYIEWLIALIDVKRHHFFPFLYISNNYQPENTQEIGDCKDDHNDRKQVVEMNDKDYSHDWEIEWIITGYDSIM